MVLCTNSHEKNSWKLPHVILILKILGWYICLYIFIQIKKPKVLFHISSILVILVRSLIHFALEMYKIRCLWETVFNAERKITLRRETLFFFFFKYCGMWFLKPYYYLDVMYAQISACTLQFSFFPCEMNLSSVIRMP